MPQPVLPEHRLSLRAPDSLFISGAVSHHWHDCPLSGEPKDYLAPVAAATQLKSCQGSDVPLLPAWATLRDDFQPGIAWTPVDGPQPDDMTYSNP